MNNEKFESLIKEFETCFKLASKATDLQDLKEKYISLEVGRENIFDWILSKVQDDEQKSEYMNKFGKIENSMWFGDNPNQITTGIPIFDLDISFDEIDEMFEEYGSYFQRYGCLTSDQIISWDKENVLFDDEFGNVEIVKRPDILLNVQ
jgi:hypothetical protein